MKTALVPVAVAAAVALLASPTSAAEKKRPMQIDDLFKFQRVADPQVSPDGKHVAYQVTSVDLEGNKTSTAIWLAATDSTTPPSSWSTPLYPKSRSSPPCKNINPSWWASPPF